MFPFCLRLLTLRSSSGEATLRMTPSGIRSKSPRFENPRSSPELRSLTQAGQSKYLSFFPRWFRETSATKKAARKPPELRQLLMAFEVARYYSKKDSRNKAFLGVFRGCSARIKMSFYVIFMYGVTVTRSLYFTNSDQKPTRTRRRPSQNHLSHHPKSLPGAKCPDTALF